MSNILEAGETNPKKKYGDTKPPLGLVPMVALEELSFVHKLGAEKYGAWNWRYNPVDTMTYISAMLRHIQQFKEESWADEESKMCHLAHVMACCAIVMDAFEHGTLEDNRPTPSTISSASLGVDEVDDLLDSKRGSNYYSK